MKNRLKPKSLWEFPKVRPLKAPKHAGWPVAKLTHGVRPPIPTKDN